MLLKRVLAALVRARGRDWGLVDGGLRLDVLVVFRHGVCFFGWGGFDCGNLFGGVYLRNQKKKRQEGRGVFGEAECLI